ncbi:MAG: class I tRNA ligase family protein, partial [Oscillospiraceae bacterium]
DIIKEYGADILRLWVASSDYHTDIRISKEILKQLKESYRKIRNTARFILGNINDFDPNKDMVSISDLEETDKLALIKLNKLIEKSISGYETLDFHIVYHALHNFCVVDMSNFYLDILKDRLYIEKADSETRKKAQSTIYTILSSLTRLMAPILAFTSQEIWQHMNHTKKNDLEHVVFNCMPEQFDIKDEEEILLKWDKISVVSQIVKKALEEARKNKVIGSSLDAEITIYTKNTTEYEFLLSIENQLKEAFIVSYVNITGSVIDGFTQEGSDIVVLVEKSKGEKCERCWCYTEDFGINDKYPTICKRCANVLG